MRRKRIATEEEMISAFASEGEILTIEEINERLRGFVHIGMLMMYQSKSTGRWYYWLTPIGVILNEYWKRRDDVPEWLARAVFLLADEPNVEIAKMIKRVFRREFGYIPQGVKESIALLLKGDKWGRVEEMLEEIEKIDAEFSQVYLVVNENGVIEKYEIAAVVDVSDKEPRIVSM